MGCARGSHKVSILTLPYLRVPWGVIVVTGVSGGSHGWVGAYAGVPRGSGRGRVPERIRAHLGRFPNQA